MAVVRYYTIAFAGAFAAGTRIFTVSNSDNSEVLWKVKSSEVTGLDFKYFPKSTDQDDPNEDTVPHPARFRIGSNDGYTIDHPCEAVFRMSDGTEHKIELQHINTAPTDFTAGNAAAMKAFRDLWYT